MDVRLHYAFVIFLVTENVSCPMEWQTYLRTQGAWETSRATHPHWAGWTLKHKAQATQTKKSGKKR